MADSPLLEPDLEGVAQGVADEVEGDDDGHDAEAGRVDDPPVAVEGVVDAVGEHRPPVGLGSRDAEPEEPERRQQEDGVGDLEGGVDDDRPDGVRDDVAEDDPGPAPAHDAHGLDVLAHPQGQRLAPDEPRRHEPGHERR